MQAAGRVVLQEVRDRLVRIALGVADEADGAAPDPAGDVRRLQVLAGFDDAAALVGDGAGVDVPRQLGQFVGEVAHGAVDGLHVPVGEGAGALDVAGAVELGALGAQAHDLAVLAEDFGGRLEEVQEQFVRAVAGVADRPVLQGLGDHVRLLVGAAGGDRALVVVDVLGVDDDLDVGRVVELAQLHRAELRLRRAAAAEDVDLQRLVGLEPVVDVRRDLRGEQLVGGLGKDAGDVEGDVADAEDGNLLGLQRPGARDVRVAVVPGDEVGGAVGAVEVDARDGEGAVGGRTGGEDDGVVERVQFVEGDVAGVVHVAEEADLRLVEDLVERGDDALDPRVVRCDAVPDQAEGGGHPLEQVDGHTRLGGGLGLQQRIGGVDSGGAGTDDCYPQGARHDRFPSTDKNWIKGNPKLRAPLPGTRPPFIAL